MANGKDLWQSANKIGETSGLKCANAMRFFALAQMLGEAERAMLAGEDLGAAERLRELQIHCEKLVTILAPHKKGRPTIVAA
jgi:hypothetical protein